MNQFLSNKIIAGIVALALLFGVGVLVSSGDTSSTTRNADLVAGTPCAKRGQVTKVSKQSVVCAKTNTGSLWYATMKAKGKAQACKPPGEIRKKSKIVWVCGVVRKKKLWQATQPLPPAVVASTTFIEPGATQPTPELDSTQVATPLVPVVADNLVLVDTKILDDKIITQAIGASPPVPGLVRYIVLFRPGKTSDTAADVVTSAHGGTENRTFENVLNGAVIDITARDRAALMNDPNVLSVEQDAVVTVTQTDAPWGLDRLDQRALPLSTTYSAPTEAINVRAFIIDTGINKKHVDFGSRVVSGFDAIDSGGDGSNDCNGHGTHVAGTVGGTTYGVAKGITLVPVRALGCTGSGTLSGVIAGLDWVVSQHQPGQLDVANMSLGAGASSALDTAVNNAITRGVSVVVAAGNSNADACNSSPARVPAAITVAASDRSDIRASFSNYGSCVDVFAPGVAITSTWWGSTTATNTISGTSMASPHVAGLAALTLQLNGVLTPAQLASVITANATTGIISSAGTNTPNRLVFIDSNPLTPPTTTPPTTTPPPSTTPTAPTCAEGGNCKVGSTGPGGGKVFYVHAGDPFTSTGSDCGSNCRYLEAAPSDHSSTVAWCSNTTNVGVAAPDIGSGMSNTTTADGTCTSGAIQVAANYTNNNKNDWHLPSRNELNELCKYSRNTGQVAGATVRCSGGTLQTGFAADFYWSSNEYNQDLAWDQDFSLGGQGKGWNAKFRASHVRLVRAFSSTCAAGGTCAVGDTGPGGGIVFYDAGTTQSWGRYLEAAPTDYQVNGSRRKVTWGCNGIFTGATAIGTGKANTVTILKECATVGIAPDVANKYSTSTAAAGQWFLPSKDELNELCKIYSNGRTDTTLYRTVQNGCTGNTSPTGGFAPYLYWSSSEYYAKGAWYQDFNVGLQAGNILSTTYYVRPVRAF